MPALLFTPRFHAPILSGVKTQTIRADRRQVPAIGDPLYLRGWSGSPYRSKQKVLLDTYCLAVEPIAVYRRSRGLAVEVAGVLIRSQALDAFARADGFDHARDMLGHYMRLGKLPFAGVLIRWLPAEEVTS